MLIVQAGADGGLGVCVSADAPLRPYADEDGNIKWIDLRTEVLLNLVFYICVRH